MSSLLYDIVLLGEIDMFNEFSLPQVLSPYEYRRVKYIQKVYGIPYSSSQD